MTASKQLISSCYVSEDTPVNRVCPPSSDSAKQTQTPMQTSFKDRIQFNKTFKQFSVITLIQAVTGFIMTPK